ncbi:MAG: sigma-54 dependent transcriptional regulator [Polyangia bacterium]|jgi:DNA-binding NtrC family response regulator
MANRFLLVDVDPVGQAALQHVAASLEGEDVVAATAEAARARLRAEAFDLCIVDMNIPDGGAQVISTAQACQPWISVVGMAGQGTVVEVVEAFRAGASDFLPRPFHHDFAVAIVRRLLRERASGILGEGTSGACLLGEHPAMRVVIERIGQAADSGASVLIRGDEGTGKEVIARLIHACGARRAGPFVTVRPGTDQQASAEPESFASSDVRPAGNVLTSLGGTLFLDDVAGLSREAQVGLLRVMKEWGSLSPSSGRSLRIVAATTQNMEHLMRDGQFLEELYYRLNVIPIEIPPLRERPEDIPILVDHFRRAANARLGRAVPPFLPDVLVRMGASPWPGNVRQLGLTVDRLVLAAKDRAVTVNDLPASLRTDVSKLGPSLVDLPPNGLDLRLLLAQLESRLIEQALQRTGGNKNRAAELLGMNRTTLVEKLRRRSVA